MTMIITIAQLETAINRASKIQPPANYVLSSDVSAMAEVYAIMIIEKPQGIDVDLLPDYKRIAIMKHLQTVPTAEDAVAVCPLRPGDPGMDACEACQ